MILDGAPNFRDLGGYEAVTGRRIARGKLFRSDDLSELSPEDVDKLAALGLRTIIDFRDREEAGSSPDRTPPTVANRCLIPVEAGRLMRNFTDGGLTRDKAIGMMLSVYRALAHDFQACYREFFRIVAEPNSAPLLFHCTAGKDRTGFAAVLLLCALGVERQVAVDDYLLSRLLLLGKYRLGVDYDETWEPLYTVRPEFIQASLDIIDRDYGGMESYLVERLGANLEALRSLYTI